MDTLSQVNDILDEVLSLNGRAATFGRSTRLLGAIPEFDSMAVVSLITALEDRIGITVDDDEIDAGTFETVGSLVSFIDGKLTG